MDLFDLNCQLWIEAQLVAANSQGQYNLERNLFDIPTSVGPIKPVLSLYSRKVSPTFGTHCSGGVQIAQMAVHFAHS